MERLKVRIVIHEEAGGRIYGRINWLAFARENKYSPDLIRRSGGFFSYFILGREREADE